MGNRHRRKSKQQKASMEIVFSSVSLTKSHGGRYYSSRHPSPPTQTHTPPPEESTQHSTCSDATPLLLPPARENSVQYYFLPCTGSKCKSTLRQRVTPVWPLYHTARGSGLGVKTGPKTTAEPKESQIIDPRKISTSYLKTALMGCRK